MTSAVDTKGNEAIATIDNKLTEAEKKLNENLKEKFDKHSRISEMSIEIHEKGIENDIKNIKAEVEKNSGDIWLIKGVEANALSSYVKTAMLQIELKREVTYILDDIIDLLTKLEDINNFDYESLDELVNKLDIYHGSKKDKIISLYKDKPVYKYVEKPFNIFPRISRIGSSLLDYSGPIKEYIKNKK